MDGYKFHEFQKVGCLWPTLPIGAAALVCLQTTVNGLTMIIYYSID